ncbi:MAG: MarR family transcriptional regulator [Acidobacteria bacterium]|nr:MarR family transcriptional regulator [Acidobacteriota bacterium]MBI3656481.1 MarR family transcriptional regulator [Acidobacteriota bacterium]
MLITERYKELIAGIHACYDRVVIQGTLANWCYAQGMTAFLKAKQIRIFDYAKLAEALTEVIRANALRVAQEAGLKIEFIRKSKAFRKEARIKEIIRERGEHPGLVHIFSAMETCSSIPTGSGHDKQTGQTFLKPRPCRGKCLHYYFYFIDKAFGLCYLRVPTWCPFALQFYFNGHNWLAHQLDQQQIPYTKLENAFLAIGDWAKAQELSDHIRIEDPDLVGALDILAARFCPALQKYGRAFRWNTKPTEYALDIVFKKPSDLKALYEPLIRTAIFAVKPEDIASFLGQKLHPNYQGELGNKFNVRILGTRIKHPMGAVTIKMYDKFGLILRLEITVNDISHFKHYRAVRQRDGSTLQKIASMKKTIYSLFPLIHILKAGTRRYLEFLSALADPSQGIKRRAKVSKTVESHDRTYKGFNFYSEEDHILFTVLARGEFNIYGLQNKNLRQHLSDKSSSAITRILKRLKAHGLVKKVAHSYKYHLTQLGKAVIAVGLTIREMLVVPGLAEIKSFCH